MPSLPLRLVAIPSILALAAGLLATAAPPAAGRGRAVNPAARLAGAGAPGGGPLDARAMWIWYLRRSDGGNVGAIASRARAAGVKTLIVKSGDGTNYWSQFTPALVAALRARGLRVCAWQYVYGTHPVAEALVAERAVRAGAECLVIDAESEYEGRYAAAQSYLRELRRRVGRGYPLGLASFPYVDYHPAFPYSVFLGPGGAQFDLPQMYWRDIRGTVAAVFDHAITENRVYRRLIRPVGQTYGSPAPAELLQFRGLTVGSGSPGISWWDFAWTSAAGLWPAIGGAVGSAGPATPGWPSLHAGSRGDEVLWLQEHLATAFPTQLTTGLFGAQTAGHLRAFQARHQLGATGRADAATWRALLRLPTVPVLWGPKAQRATTGPPARRSLRAALAPASAALPARAREIPELGSARGRSDPAHAEPG